MKALSTLFCIFFLLIVSIHSQVPTDAGIPDANHVLVVWNSNSSVSDSVMQYYVATRGIPQSNIVPLPLPEYQDITIDDETHRVKIVQVTDIIQDSVNNANYAEIPTKHAFKYFLDNIATPIKNWITSHNLTSVRYILLVKGVPFKIQAARDYGGFQRGNLTVDGLLCMLNTPDYDSFILDNVFYTNSRSNPYFNADPYFTMEFRFLPDHFIVPQGHHLSYLVSHLDGISFDVVKSIIDKSKYPDMSGTAYWILDDDPGWTSGEFIATRDKLEELGFNVFWNDDDTWITSYPQKVIGYTSWGTHAEDYNCNFNDSAWVKDSLRFDLANGSVFNTYESFNGNSLTSLNWRYVAVDTNCSGHTQDLATQFTEIGGTGTMGHAWEPGTGSIVENQLFFPAYQIGYNLVDAFYQGLPNIAWQNVLVGDPLLRIYECENTVISSNTTISDGTYYCNVTVPPDVILKIEAGSVINFQRNAQLRIYGTLEVEDNAILNFEGYSKLVLNVSGSVVQSQNTTFNFYNKAKCISNRELTISAGQNFVFNDESEFVIGKLTFNSNSVITFKKNARIMVNEEMSVHQGTELNFLNSSKMLVTGLFICIGESNNKIIFNSATTSELRIENGIVINIDNTILNNNGISVLISSNLLEPESLSITNSTFNNANSGINISLNGIPFLSTPLISNCTETFEKLSYLIENSLNRFFYKVYLSFHFNFIYVFCSLTY